MDQWKNINNHQELSAIEGLIIAQDRTKNSAEITPRWTYYCLNTGLVKSVQRITSNISPIWFLSLSKTWEL